jgi:hypothetical protein
VSAHPASRNDAVFETLEPFLIAAPWNMAHYDRAPFGVPIHEENVFDPTRSGSAAFLRRLTVLDELTFGPEGMPMPGWVLYHGAAVPGGVFGFGRRAEDLPRDVIRRIGLGDDETGLMPLSMWVALPSRPRGGWFGHNLASLNPVCPELGLKGLASITKAMAMKTLRCRVQVGATQWASRALGIHSRFGPMELITAWTPAHSDPATLTYRLDVNETGLRAALGDPDAEVPRPAANLELAINDTKGMQALQERLERGERICVVGPPRPGDDGKITVPLAHGEMTMESDQATTRPGD